MVNNYLFTSESVTEGHPDKLCDIVSDSILDEYMKADPKARVACEVAATTGTVILLGEITSSANIDMVSTVRKVINEIGYKDDTFGFNGNTCAVIMSIDKQSDDINIGVSNSLEHKSLKAGTHLDTNEAKDLIGAGDQGMMFGYACNETDSFMPAPIYYSHKLCYRLGFIMKNNLLDYIGPDGKSMVTIEYKDNKPYRINTIVVSAQHKADISQERIYNDIVEYVINPVIPKGLMDKNTRLLINPTGRFVKGGPCADTGLTGRKIIVDTYGGMGRHGGGAFSGKDPTKVDRTGAYAARYTAKNIVAAGLAQKCEVQISYAIGVANPVSINVNTFGTSMISEDKISAMVNSIFDLRPASLIEQFHMRSPIYRKLASYGHVGRDDLDVAWENINKVDEIRAYFNIK
ncbi:MAG: S-adenosylmethionine synthetase [Herbinix sp.]|jgi:S-adenosylmethionine synthetase|nr:S-adenosylmethionine synthetase [Herbinix sp.]